MKPKYLYDNDPWMLGEDIPNADLFFSTIWLNGFVSFFDMQTGRAYSKILCKYEGYHLWFYFGERDSFEAGEHLAERIVNEPGYAEEINKHIIIEADKLSTYSEKIPQSNLQTLSNEELWNIYEGHYKVHSHYYTWCWVPVCVDMFHNNLTRRVKEYLRTIGVSEEKLNEYFVILTQPTKKSLIFVEQENLLNIAAEIEKVPGLADIFLGHNAKHIKSVLPAPIAKLLEEHWKTYYYTKHLWVSGEYTVEDYIAQLQDIFKAKESAQTILEKQYKELDKAKQKRNDLLAKLDIKGQWRAVLDAFGDFMITKIYRRYAQLMAVHHMSAILKEIARRAYLTEKQVRFMRTAEVKELLLENKVDSEELLKRTKLCVYYAERGYEKIFTGKEAEEVMKPIEKTVDMSVKELRGESACIGYAKGKVKIIIRAEDMSKMEVGDILVSIATDPDIVPAMKKAAAIVTEQGGVTSHAAIVSRELGIPCVIGTKIATRVLKDGDMVEVDANKGIVKKITD